MDDETLIHQQQTLVNHWQHCYKSNNYFAYVYDLYRSNDNSQNKERVMTYLRIYNFVPTHNKCCLYCESKTASKKCSKCKTVYFCDKNCRKGAQKIRKKHCGRNLFKICSCCGKDDVAIKCFNCPVSFCSERCRKKIIVSHRKMDCPHFSRYN